MVWSKNTIITEDGREVEAQEPVIVSASRSTDIPAFYSDWFFHRLKVGYSVWTNPFNGSKSYVSYAKTKFIVFWSKNPRPLLGRLNELKDKGIKCYIQFTLNDYVQEGLEKNVPSVESRIDTFKRLVDVLGKGSVIWRFDPLILADKMTVDDLIAKIRYIGNQLLGFTDKLVFSFVDISMYRKVGSNLKKSGVNYREWTTELMNEFAYKLSVVNREWGYELSTCGEKIDLDQYGIRHNKCIDDDLIIRIASEDYELMRYLGVSVDECGLFGDIPIGAIDLGNGKYAVKKIALKDKGQRTFCGCMESKDIGEYNTCIHQCEYCYANASKELADRNYQRHKLSPLSETITGL